jgi:hypothetical protein
MGGEEELIYRTNLFEGLFRHFNVMQIVRLGDFCIMFREGFQEGGAVQRFRTVYMKIVYAYDYSIAIVG